MKKLLPIDNCVECKHFGYYCSKNGLSVILLCELENRVIPRKEGEIFEIPSFCPLNNENEMVYCWREARPYSTDTK